MKNSNLISIIIPVYNEEGSLNTLYLELLDTLNNYELEIIFINDGSFDDSPNIIKDII